MRRLISEGVRGGNLASDLEKARKGRGYKPTEVLSLEELDEQGGAENSDEKAGSSELDDAELARRREELREELEEKRFKTSLDAVGESNSRLRAQITTRRLEIEKGKKEEDGPEETKIIVGEAGKVGKEVVALAKPVRTTVGIGRRVEGQKGFKYQGSGHRGTHKPRYKDQRPSSEASM